MRIVTCSRGDLEPADLGAALLCPLGGEALLAAAHRAVAIAVAGVEGEGGLE